MLEKTRPIAERHRKNTHIAYEKGVEIAAGTDAGTPLNPHPNLARELELLHEVGLSLADVLRAATTLGARALGLEGLIGTLAEGACADLVALDQNPLETPLAYRHPRATVMAGEVLMKV
jgi:imidazolonepropionase-like amidohydrolase